MKMADAWVEDILSRLVVVSVLALLALGIYQLSSLRRDLRAMRSDLAAMRADLDATRAVVADGDDGDDDYGDNTDEESRTGDVAAAEDDLFSQHAQDAYVHGQFGDAMQLSLRLTDTQPSRGWRIFGASACYLKERSDALKAYEHLAPTDRKFVSYVCSRCGITLP